MSNMAFQCRPDMGKGYTNATVRQVPAADTRSVERHSSAHCCNDVVVGLLVTGSAIERFSSQCRRTADKHRVFLRLGRIESIDVLEIGAEIFCHRFALFSSSLASSKHLLQRPVNDTDFNPEQRVLRFLSEWKH